MSDAYGIVCLYRIHITSHRNGWPLDPKGRFDSSKNHCLMPTASLPKL